MMSLKLSDVCDNNCFSVRLITITNVWVIHFCHTAVTTSWWIGFSPPKTKLSELFLKHFSLVHCLLRNSEDFLLKEQKWHVTGVQPKWPRDNMEVHFYSHATFSQAKCLPALLTAERCGSLQRMTQSWGWSGWLWPWKKNAKNFLNKKWEIKGISMRMYVYVCWMT